MLENCNVNDQVTDIYGTNLSVLKSYILHETIIFSNIDPPWFNKKRYLLTKNVSQKQKQRQGLS